MTRPRPRRHTRQKAPPSRPAQDIRRSPAMAALCLRTRRPMPARLQPSRSCCSRTMPSRHPMLPPHVPLPYLYRGVDRARLHRCRPLPISSRSGLSSAPRRCRHHQRWRHPEPHPPKVVHPPRALLPTTHAANPQVPRRSDQQAAAACHQPSGGRAVASTRRHPYERRHAPPTLPPRMVAHRTRRATRRATRHAPPPSLTPRDPPYKRITRATRKRRTNTTGTIAPGRQRALRVVEAAGVDVVRPLLPSLQRPEAAAARRPSPYVAR